MPLPRSETVDPLLECTYHCWSRCVRRAFLCGFDRFTGKNHDHRKQWIVDRMKLLVGLFAIEVYAYAVMDNHMHLVIKNFTKTAFSWSPEEIARRWLLLFPKRRDDEGHALEPNLAEIESITEDPSQVEKLRIRLCDISWFMRCLNENIARRANIEDDVTGHFWEGRFKSTRLDDEAAVLTGMVYVDLNPIRAEKAYTPEESQFTSAYLRLCAEMLESGDKEPLPKKKHQADSWLFPIKRIFEKQGDFDTRAYLQILDVTGRITVEGKSGSIPSELEPILKRIGINSSTWPDSTLEFRKTFPRVAGNTEHMRRAAKKAGRNWFKGLSMAASCF